VDENKIPARIRALFAQADHPTTGKAEAEAFRAKGQALMLQYAIDAAVLRGVDTNAADFTARRIDLPAPYAKEKSVLLNAVATPLLGYVVTTRSVVRISPKGYRTASWSEGVYATVYGTESDLAQIEFLFTSLVLQSSTEMAKARPENPREDVAAFRTSWLYGFASTVHSRLLALRQTQVDEQPGSGTDLVLASHEDKLRAFVNEQAPNAKEGKPITYSGSGRGAGAAAGRRADLNQTKVSNKPRTGVGR
jgi:hypothetical protein